MKKNVVKILWVVGIYVFIFFCCAPIAHAVDVSNINNGHTYKSSNYADKGVCDNCHMPHGAVGEKLWSDYSLKDDPKSNKVKDLCGSCHYTDVAGFTGIIESGRLEGDNGNVFLLVHGSDTETKGADHIMGFSNPAGNDASVYHTSKAKFNTTTFPFDDDDEEINEGFYCGSCHDPHKQPLDASNNPITNGDGDYLRSAPGKVGVHNDRKDFCRQCHLNDYVGDPDNPDDPAVLVHKGLNPDPQCYDCHRVHDAHKYDDPSNEMQDLIFVDPVEPQDWFQLPSGIDINSEKYYESQDCINCHTAPNPGTIWEKAPRLPRNRMHHPNGRKWENTSCSIGTCHPLATSSAVVIDRIFNNLDGYHEKGGARLDVADRVFSCTSCHAAHSEEGYTNFLRFANFEEDATDFCEYCHKTVDGFDHRTKSADSLKANGGGHFKTQAAAGALTRPIKRTVWNIDPDTGVGAEEEVGCGGCMFCHFIHPKESDGDTRVVSDPLRTDLQALMRIPAEELNWDEGANVNTLDAIDRYEAMCYGCHSDDGIVGGSGKNGSLLDITKFSHRFASFPVADNNPQTNITEKGFHQSDAAGADEIDDYGTVYNQIYCGTCHDVHDNRKNPYLYLVDDENPESAASPYQAGGFCEQCHGQDPGAGIANPHPVGDEYVPSLPLTVTEWLADFWGGGSGSDKGITHNTTIIPPISGGTDKGGVLCLTCHNIHAATTSWDRKAKNDPDDPVPIDETKDHGPILVMDNFQNPTNADSIGSDMCLACHPF